MHMSFDLIFTIIHFTDESELEARVFHLFVNYTFLLGIFYIPDTLLGTEGEYIVNLNSLCLYPREETNNNQTNKMCVCGGGVYERVYACMHMYMYAIGHQVDVHALKNN